MEARWWNPTPRLLSGLSVLQSIVWIWRVEMKQKVVLKWCTMWAASRPGAWFLSTFIIHLSVIHPQWWFPCWAKLRGDQRVRKHTRTHTHTRTRTRMLSLYYEVKNRSWQRIKGLILRTLKKYFSLQVTSGSLAPHSLLTVWEHTVCLYPQLNYWWSHAHLPSDRIRIHCNIIT